jgi:hypothetical protein
VVQAAQTEPMLGVNLARIFHTPCDEIGGSVVEIVIELALMP